MTRLEHAPAAPRGLATTGSGSPPSDRRPPSGTTLVAEFERLQRELSVTRGELRVARLDAQRAAAANQALGRVVRSLRTAALALRAENDELRRTVAERPER